GRAIVDGILVKLPPYTEQAVRRVLGQLDHVNENLKVIEAQMMEAFAPCAETNLLKSLPGVGDILAVVIWTGTMERFARAEQFASYCGLVAREHSSGGKFHYGAVSRGVKVYLQCGVVRVGVR